MSRAKHTKNTQTTQIRRTLTKNARKNIQASVMIFFYNFDLEDTEIDRPDWTEKKLLCDFFRLEHYAANCPGSRHYL